MKQSPFHNAPQTSYFPPYYLFSRIRHFEKTMIIPICSLRNQKSDDKSHELQLTIEGYKCMKYTTKKLKSKMRMSGRNPNSDSKSHEPQLTIQWFRCMKNTANMLKSKVRMSGHIAILDSDSTY